MARHLNAHALKYALGFLLVMVFRLIPFRIPNVEPVMATMMPFAKHFGAFGGAFFAGFSIVLYDSVTSGLGVWTLVTAVVYAILGAGAAWYFEHRTPTRGSFVRFAVVSTLIYDIATGLTIGPMVWHQPLMVALVGQIPFTVLHLVSNIVFAAVLSPLIYRWVVAREVPALAPALRG